jgi:hypothetical protein
MREQLSGLGLQECDHVAFVDVLAVLGIFRWRKRALVCLAAELFDALAECFVGTPIDYPLRDLRRQPSIGGI